MNRSIISTLLAAGLAAAAPLATAQAAGPGTTAPQHRLSEQYHQGERPFSLPGERVEARLAYIRTALKITDAQQSQWNAFADVMRKNARQADERIKARRASMTERTEHQRATAIERLERAQARLASASARLSEIIAVEKPLYAALSPEQKRIADRVLVPGGHGKFHRWSRHRPA